jgi:hypothetical protein
MGWISLDIVELSEERVRLSQGEEVMSSPLFSPPRLSPVVFQADVVSLLILTTPIAVLGLGDRPYIIISIQPAIITSPPWVGLIELLSATLPRPISPGDRSSGSCESLASGFGTPCLTGEIVTK